MHRSAGELPTATPRPAKNSASLIRARLPPAGTRADKSPEPGTGAKAALVIAVKAVSATGVMPVAGVVPVIGVVLVTGARVVPVIAVRAVWVTGGKAVPVIVLRPERVTGQGVPGKGVVAGQAALTRARHSIRVNHASIHRLPAIVAHQVAHR